MAAPEGGRRLRLLCLHDEAQSPEVFRKQLEAMLAADPELLRRFDLECATAPLKVPPPEVPPADAASCIICGGTPRRWYRVQRPGQLGEQRSGVEEALDLVLKRFSSGGPWDGVCGCGQGGFLAATLAKLAEERHPALRGGLRLVLCINATWPPGRGSRPKAPLRTPACILYPDNGPCPVPCYECLALHWAPSAREVVVHSDGGAMPALGADGVAQLRRLLARHDIAPGLELEEPTSPHMGDVLRSLALPIVPRVADAPEALAEGARVFAVCFHDVGAKDFSGTDAFDDLVLKASRCSEFRNRLTFDAPEMARIVSLAGVASTEKEAARSCPSVPHEFVVSPRGVAAAEAVVGSVLQSDLGGAPAVVIGIGFGAYVALQYALALEAMDREIRFTVDGRSLLGIVKGRRVRQDGSHVEYLLEVGDGWNANGPARWAWLDEARMTLSDELGHEDVPFEAVSESRGCPWWLFAVRPPAVFPPAGALAACAVTALLSEGDAAGERWRLEAATGGAYAVVPEAAAWPDAVVAALRPLFAQSVVRHV